MNPKVNIRLDESFFMTGKFPVPPSLMVHENYALYQSMRLYLNGSTYTLTPVVENDRNRMSTSGSFYRPPVYFIVFLDDKDRDKIRKDYSFFLDRAEKGAYIQLVADVIPGNSELILRVAEAQVVVASWVVN